MAHVSPAFRAHLYPGTNQMISFNSTTWISAKVGSTRDECVLLVRNDHSGYSCLFPFVNTNAMNAAHATFDWCIVSGTSSELMFDKNTHFRDETVQLVTKRFRSSYRFTVCLTIYEAMVQ